MSYDFFLVLSETADFRMFLFPSSSAECTEDLFSSPFFSSHSCFEFDTGDTDLPAGGYNLKKKKKNTQ